MVKDKISCEECEASLFASEHSTTPSFKLLRRKKWGSLIEASDYMISVSVETEKVLYQLSIQNPSSMANPKLNLTISISVKKKLFYKTN